MYYDLSDARYLKDYQIQVKFEDGSGGTADLSEFVKKGGVLSKLRNINNFKRFYIHTELKVLCWPGEIDIAPEMLYHLATGNPLPAWAEHDTVKLQ